MRPLFAALCALGTAAALPSLALAQPRTIAVLAGDQPTLAIQLELALSRSRDTVLLLAPSQTLARQQLGIAPERALLDDDTLKRLGRLAGAETVVQLGASHRICTSDQCRAVTGQDLPTVLQALSVPVPDAAALPSNAQVTPYVDCRRQALALLQTVAIDGSEADGAPAARACEAAVVATPNFAPARAARAAVQALAGSSWEPLALLMREVPHDAVAAPALAHAVLNDPHASVSTRQQVVDLARASAPRSLELARVVAEELFHCDNFDSASEAFARAAALAPLSPELLSRQAYALHARGKHIDSVSVAERSWRLGAGVPHYQMEYASRLMDVGRFEQARALLEPLHTADRTWGRAALRLGYALLRLGRAADALPLFAAAADSTPRSPYEQGDRRMALLDMAQAQARLGRTDEALAALDRARQLGGVSEIELQDKDFDGLRGDPRFNRLLNP